MVGSQARLKEGSLEEDASGAINIRDYWTAHRSCLRRHIAFVPQLSKIGVVNGQTTNGNPT